MTGKKIRLLMILIFALQIINALYWGCRKEGYYIDELWSYGLSNSYYVPFLQNKEGYMYQWHEPEFYMDYLTVNEGEGFAYGSVYVNQAQDVHPPLYYMVLHTVCSLFAGGFSKWHGLFVNILFFGGSLWLLYGISGQILGKENPARLIPPFVYGFSGGALSTVMYIRMYMLLTFFALLFALMTFLAMEDSENGALLYGGIGVTVAGGFMTQYYFLIFAFFVSTVYLLWRLFHRRWKEAAVYASAVFGGMGAGVLLFPACISQIFLGQKGKDSMSNAFLGGRAFSVRLRQYDRIISEEFWGGLAGTGIIFAAVILLGLALFIAQWVKQGKRPRTDIKWLTLFTAVTGYFCVVAMISTDISDRYQFAIYPAGALVITAAVYYFLSKIRRDRLFFAAAVCYVFFSFYNYGKGSINYIGEGYEKTRQALETVYKDVPGIYITTGDHLVINDCLFLAQQDRTLPLGQEQITELPRILKGIQGDELILYVNIYYDEQQAADRTAEILGYQTVSLLYDNTYTRIFVLSGT